MFNAFVINIKDIGKYIIKISIILGVIIVSINTINKLKFSSKENGSINFSLKQCIDICLPGIKQIQINGQDSISFAQILNMELQISRHTETKEYQNEEQNEDIVCYEINEKIPDNPTTEVLKTNVEERYTNSYKTVNIKNESDYNLTEEMLEPNVELKDSRKILIYHTHTCESYSPSDAFPYEMTGTFRTTDLDYSVARVGTELTNFLEKYGFSVMHDITYHDYPAYSGSYDRSYETAENDLDKLPDTEIIFDIHRDAIGDSTYAPTVKIGDEYASQIMFVIGTDGGGLKHPNWTQNLKLAVKIQLKANEKYPGLFKPIILRNSRYNQNLAKGASIIEVGATGNTLEQSIASMKYLADILNEVL